MAMNRFDTEFADKLNRRQAREIGAFMPQYRIATSESPMGGFYCILKEIVRARAKRDGHEFLKCTRFITVENNRRFPTRQDALTAGRVVRESLKRR